MKLAIRALAAALLLPCGAGLAQGPTLYIDPIAGVDTPGGGAPTSPLRSLTYAIAAVGPAGPATFRLRPGLYAAPNEVFPMALPDVCVVEADPATTVRGMQQVQIAGYPVGAGHSGSLVVGGRGAGPVDVTLRGLLVEGALGGAAYIAVLVDGPNGTGTLNLMVDDCVLNHYRDIEAVIGGNTVATMSAVNCTMRGLDQQVRVTARGTSLAVLSIDRGLVTGAFVGADLISTGGTVVATFRGARFVDAGLYGVRLGTTNNGTIQVRAEHCLFRKCGTRAIGLPPQNYGAFVEDAAGQVGTRQVRIENSIFSGNQNDCPHYSAANYVFGRNLVQQANLIGVGGNFNGPAAFVDVTGNDFRLLPGSAAVDAGDPTAVTLMTDFEGNPRFHGSNPDIGPDEYHPLYLYATGPARVGGPWPTWLVFNALAPAGTAFGGFVSFGQNNLPWGPGVLHLAQPIYGTMFFATVAANGLGQAAIQLPVAPYMIGIETWWQGGFTQPPYLGINSNRVLFRP